MKVVILAGGFGTRVSEESHLKPKPMIEIGEKPILWHVMKEYSVYGINEFIICAGYKQHVIKEWFADYFIHTSDITFDFTIGGEFPQDLSEYKLVVHCGGCMLNEREMKSRQEKAQKYKIPMVNYGMAIAHMNGILKRSLEVFDK